MSLSRAEFLEGAVLLAALLLPCIAAGGLVARRRLPGAPLPELALAWFALTTTAVLFAHLVPGVFGILTRWTAIAAALIAAAAATRVPPAGAQVAGPPEPAASPPWSWGIAAAGAGIAAVGAVAYLIERSTSVVQAVDSMTFHLPAVARWIQTESVWGLHQFSPEFSNATYPQNGVVMQLAAVLPWNDAFLARYVNVAFVAALAVAVYALARELRAPRSAAALAGAAATVLPAVSYPALEQAQVDAPGLAWLAIGVLFLARWARTRDARELMPAGIGLGLAFGTKWYHVVFVPLLVALCVGGLVWATRRWRPLVRPVAVLAGWIGAVGGFWLIRNWVETANPVYPAKVPPLFDAPESRLDAIAGFRVWDYLTDSEIWREWLLPAWKSQFGYLPLLLAATLAAAAAVAWRARRDGGRPVLLAVVATAALALFYARLPWTAYGPPGEPVLAAANSRYAVPAVVGGLVVTAWLAGRSRAPARPAIELAVLVLLVDCARRAWDFGAGSLVRAVLLAAAVAVVALALALLADRARARGRLRPAAAAAALLIIAGALVAGDNLRRRAQSDSYTRYDPVFTWIHERAPAGSKIGLAGLWSLRGISPAFPAFGPELRNDVEFVGPFVEHTLQNYGQRRPYQAAVRRGNYDLIVLGLGFARELPPERVPRVGWTRALGYEAVARSNRLLLLRRGS